VTYASTACLGRPDLWTALDAFRASGIDAVELGACRLDDEKELAARLRATGMRFVIHNYFPPTDAELVLNLASPSEEIRSRSASFASRTLDLAGEIGAGTYSVHAGFATDPIGYEDGHFVFGSGGDVQSARDRFADSIATLAERARTVGVELLVENNVCIGEHRGRLLFLTGAEIASFLEPLRDLGVRLLLDTGHLNVTSRTLGFDRDEFVDDVEDFVGAVHVHDNDGTSDGHMPVVEDSWIAALLRRPSLSRLPRVVEARVGSAGEAKDQVDFLERLARDD